MRRSALRAERGGIRPPHTEQWNGITAGERSERQRDEGGGRRLSDRNTASASSIQGRDVTEHKGRWRRVFAVLFVALFIILVPVTVTATWAHYTVINEKGWIDTVGPIAKDPAVKAALSREVTDQLFAALNPQEAIAEALPPKAMFLAAPIATGVHGFIEERVTKIVNNPKFEELWITANRNAHTRLVKVLRGDSEALESTNGQVVLNLVPLLKSVLVNIEGFASNVVGKPIDLPEIKADEVPASACAKIAKALDRPVRPNCGQNALFPADNLDSARRGVQRLRSTVVVALLIITPLVAVVALLLSLRRRRTLLQLSHRRDLRPRPRSPLDDVARGPADRGASRRTRAARSAIVNHALDSFMSITQWLLVGLLVISVLAISSPAPIAGRLPYGRGRSATYGRSATCSAAEAPLTATIRRRAGFRLTSTCYGAPASSSPPSCCSCRSAVLGASSSWPWCSRSYELLLSRLHRPPTAAA